MMHSMTHIIYKYYTETNNIQVPRAVIHNTAATV